MIRKLVLPLLAIIGLAVALAMVISGNRAAPTAQTLVQSANAPFTSYVFGPGTVEASTEKIAIGTPVSGIVTAIYCKWAGRVKRRAPVVEGYTPALEGRVLPANANG